MSTRRRWHSSGPRHSAGRFAPIPPRNIDALAAQGLTPETDPSVCVDPPDASLPTLWFNRVPEPKVGKVRIHMDVNLSDAAGIQRLIDLGASIIQDRPGGNEWTIMADPEGNEFCAFVVGR